MKGKKHDVKMLKSKIVTLGVASVMGVASLGIPQFIAHAATTKSGNTVISYYKNGTTTERLGDFCTSHS